MMQCGGFQDRLATVVGSEETGCYVRAADVRSGIYSHSSLRFGSGIEYPRLESQSLLTRRPEWNMYRAPLKAAPRVRDSPSCRGGDLNAT